MPGLLRGLARTAMVAGTATAVSNRVSRRQAGRWAAQEYPQQQYPPQEYQQQDYQQQYPPQQQAPPQQAPPAAPAGGGYDQVLAQLKDLGDLKAQGVLSEAEFETQKRRILGG
ncbi:SHOCT domain-containing protein [Actinomycetospora sp. NBC_00405]|uniref:SHOCT domain-containing protein n=1 Tax=Actinomycetospora sp. NBC_00405 TaxID=2975952 RepID=UPI002E203B80